MGRIYAVVCEIRWGKGTSIMKFSLIAKFLHQGKSLHTKIYTSLKFIDCLPFPRRVRKKIVWNTFTQSYGGLCVYQARDTVVLNNQAISHKSPPQYSYDFLVLHGKLEITTKWLGVSRLDHEEKHVTKFMNLNLLNRKARDPVDQFPWNFVIHSLLSHVLATAIKILKTYPKWGKIHTDIHGPSIGYWPE